MVKLSIIIPVFNENRTIEEVIKRVSQVSLKNIQKEIIVIDDCSTDGTDKIINSLHGKYKFLSLKNIRNSGKGYSVRRGLEIATGEVLMIQDADLEYDINEYPDLLEPILKGKAKFVLGSRHLQKGAWRMRQFLDSRVYAKILNTGSIFYSKLFNWVYGVNLTDPGTMYKVFRKECLHGVELKSNHFDIDWELVGKLIKKKIVPLEVAISYKSRSPKEGKKIKFLRDGVLILTAIIRYRITN
jgi:glycosyltransferase involved in cell wall biosynthesis